MYSLKHIIIMIKEKIIKVRSFEVHTSELPFCNVFLVMKGDNTLHVNICCDLGV